MRRGALDELIGQAQGGSPQGVEVLRDAGQGRGRPTRQGDVVEANDGDVVRNPDTGGEQLVTQTQGDVIVAGEDGIGQSALKQTPSDFGSGLSRPGVGSDPATRNPRLGTGRLVGGKALGGVLPRQVPGDVEWSRASLSEKVLRRQPGSQRLVDGDG